MSERSTSGNPETIERILDGALTALARRGLRKLSMSDICDAAGLSRGTVYRYFRDKDDVLDALGSHVEAQFQESMAAAIERSGDRADRIRVVLEVIASLAVTMPQSVAIIEAEPGFALRFLRRELPQFVTTVEQALAPTADQIPAVRDGALTGTELAELVLRLGMSAFLLPGGSSSELPRIADALWRKIVADAAGV